MTRSRTLVLLCLCMTLMPASSAIAGERLSFAALKKLLGWKGKTEISKQESINLVNKEQAWLLVATSSEMVHATANQLVLYRPTQKRAKSLGPAFEGFVVKDLDHDGVSEVQVDFGFSNMGTSEGGSELARFEGWNKVTLYEFTHSSNNAGMCGESYGPCESTEVALEYKDLDGDGVTDVTETVKFTKDEKAAPPTVTQYLFKAGKVVKK